MYFQHKRCLLYKFIKPNKTGDVMNIVRTFLWVYTSLTTVYCDPSYVCIVQHFNLIDQCPSQLLMPRSHARVLSITRDSLSPMQSSANLRIPTTICDLSALNICEIYIFSRYFHFEFYLYPVFIFCCNDCNTMTIGNTNKIIEMQCTGVHSFPERF